MADMHTSRLCVQIIHSHFGPITASVASTLLARGRLPLVQILRTTSYKPRTILQSILVLIQHNLLWHARTDEEGEVFEMNVDECLTRLRFGRIVWQAEELFGTVAADVIQIVLDHGKLRPPDILSHLSVQDPKSAAIYTQIMHNFISQSYLKPSTALSHLPPRDKRIRYEAEESAKISGLPTAKEIRQAKEAAQTRLRREEEEESIGLKSKTKEWLTQRPSTRRVVENVEYAIDDNIYLRVNFDKFNIHIRNSLIVKSAKERYNTSAAIVLQAILKLTESKQQNVSDIRTEPISTSNLVLNLAGISQLASGVILPKKASHSACVKEYLGILSSADNPTPAGRAGSFISYKSSKIHVEFEIIYRRLRRRVLESVARERYGTEGVRIMRLLLDTGKMDEKQISKIAMLVPKDVKPLLAGLAADSLISTQEVPKSADRNPARTFYLWYVDLNKANSVVLGNIYKILYNIVTRRRAEQEATGVKVVLEKRERVDVSQDESLLSRFEKEVLSEWESKQKKLTVLEMRVEETAFILKDLSGSETNED